MSLIFGVSRLPPGRAASPASIGTSPQFADLRQIEALVVFGSGAWDSLGRGRFRGRAARVRRVP